jgi:hypothetical protein
VKRSAFPKWSFVTIALVLVAAAALWLTGWRPNFDSSIELSNRFGDVENGSAYDKAVLDVGSIKKILLPHDALVRRTPQAVPIQVFMKKSMSFHGHPPESMSIRHARKNMGCAVKRDGQGLVLATFGEWDSHIEGGTRMKLVVAVPEGIEVEQKEGLSGEDSAGQEWHGTYITKPRDAKGGYWYGPASPAEGWEALPDVPDPDRTAR